MEEREKGRRGEGGRTRLRRLHALFLFSALPLLLSLSACEALRLDPPPRPAATDWTDEGGGPMRQRATPLALRPPLEIAWTANVEGGFGPGGPLVADGVALVPTRKGEVVALAVEDGKRLGVEKFSGPVEGTPVLVDGLLIAAGHAGRSTLTAHDLRRGQTRWRRQIGDVSAGLLALAGSGQALVIAAGLDGSVRAFDTATGEDRWTVPADSGRAYRATPVALGTDRFAAADDRGRVSAFETATGRMLWTADAGAPVYAAPAADAERLYVPTTRGRLVALDAVTGQEAWALEADSLIRFTSPAVIANQIIVTGTDGIVRSLDAGTGAERWRSADLGPISAAPLVTGGIVYVGTLDAEVLALDLETGEVLWREEVRGRVKTAPVPAGGMLLVATEPRHVVAFAPVPEPVAADD